MTALTLADFLRARLEEDAAAVAEARELTDSGGLGEEGESGETWEMRPAVDSSYGTEGKVKIATRRARAEIAARSLTLDLYEECAGSLWGHAVRAMALAYDTHPDYDGAWRVEVAR